MARAIVPLLIALLSVLCGLVLWNRRYHAQVDRSSATTIHHRLRKPRTPADCPACRREPACSAAASAQLAVRPGKERKRRRGAPNRIPTDGFACPNHACWYHGITNAQVHALVGDGTHGTHARIQTFRCQACGPTFTARRDTPR